MNSTADTYSLKDEEILGAPMSHSSDLSEGQTGRIDYDSSAVFEIHHILKKLDSAPTQSTFGHLQLPSEGEGPFPCVVAIHGSRGWRPHNDIHIANWLDAGIAVFRVHSFDARGIDGVVETQMEVTHATMLVDAYNALKLLGSHPQIDAERIGIAGWSLGGLVALYSAWLPIAEKLAPQGQRFAAHLPIYPAAHIRTEIMEWSKSPIHILHGAIDDYTPAIHATQMVDLLLQVGANASLTIYPDAHHSFDSYEEVTFNATALKIDERTIQIDADGDMSGEILPGVHIPLNEPEQRFAAFQQTKLLGAHYGGQKEARDQSRIDAVEFLINSLR